MDRPRVWAAIDRRWYTVRRLTEAQWFMRVEADSSMLTEHEIEIRVRYQETDPMGLLHHAHYFTYFEIGRTELLRAAGGNYRKMEEEGLLVVVVKAECRYRVPARYDDVLTVRTTVTRVTPAKIMHQYEVLRDGTQLAVGLVTLAIVDREGNVQPTPEWMRQ